MGPRTQKYINLTDLTLAGTGKRMDKSYEAKYHKAEEMQWWFRSRRDIIFRLIRRENKNSKILDVGCSSGPLMSLLRRRGFNNISGIDLSDKAIESCKNKGIKNSFVMDCAKMSFKDNEFDIIIASDILEHIDDEDQALSELNRVLKPNGKLVIFVPAFNLLWGMHDEINHHRRRYSKRYLVKVLRKNNFIIKRSSFWNISLFFPGSIVRLLQRVIPKKISKKNDQLYVVNYMTNNLLMRIFKLENKFLQNFNLPFGLSVFAIAVKKN